MRPGAVIGRLETTCCRLWAALAVILIAVELANAIRVYEGTNFQGPTPKPSKFDGSSKKSSYISKRSWTPIEEKTVKGISKRTGVEGMPALYKIKFNDKNLMQYLRYIKEMPKLEEYTFCLWYKSANLSHDQTLFSYSLNKDEVLLRFWLNAMDSTLRMSIRENPVFKVLTTIRQNKWYHICQSWSGILGEWQVFLDGKRIGAGVLPYYKGTYIPEGGEVTLGQELIGLHKRLGDGMDGEVFGFNLVDEAVPQDQIVFISSQSRSNSQNVPPFKKLPPIKKTYQEIKAYISSLPSDSSEVRKKNEALLGQTTSAIKKPKESYSVPPKRTRGSQRLRYPPLRKVVVYNRDDRQLELKDASIELNKTKAAAQFLNRTSEVKKVATQPAGIHYSIHSYQFGKSEREPKNYEIYEVVEDDGEGAVSEDELTKEQSLERKARQNFNLFTAREANRVYTLSSSVKDAKKPLFHFERRTEEPEKSSRRSFEADDHHLGSPVTETMRTASDPIPVHEPQLAPDRRKRSANGDAEPRQLTTVTDDPHMDSNGFRRLPQIPESFISIFTQNASKSEIEQKLDKFFPRETTSEETNVVVAITEAHEMSSPPVTVTAAAPVEKTTTEAPIPPFSPVPPQLLARISSSDVQYSDGLSDPGPVNFPLVRDFNPSPPSEEDRPPMSIGKPVQVQERVMEKRYEVTSGTDLVMRSYVECTAGRGSPLREKQHLIVSWADTPVRIFGGAQVEGARNQCGHF